jgi:uncharacterized protein (DUF58 family)
MALSPHLDDLLELRHQARALGLPSHHLVNSALAGMYASVFRGQGLDFEEVREYREGDDIRNMQWHVTARTGVPHVKVFCEERERTVMLCVDQGVHMSFGTRGTFKSVQAARAAALLGWSASLHRDRVGGLVFGHPARGLRHYRATRGRRALWRTLRALTQGPEEGRDAEGALLSALLQMTRGIPTGSLIFVIAGLDRDVTDLRVALGGLRQRHQVALLPVDDPADWSIPAMGQVLFRGPDGRLLELDTDDERGRERYQSAWEGRRRVLKEVASRLGIALIPLRTDRDVHEALLEGLRCRARTRVYR